MDYYLKLLTLVCVIFCSAVPSASTRRGQFDKIRDGNCPSCRERLQISVAEVLPRLSLIKQRILNALGRKVEETSNRKPAEASRSLNAHSASLPDIIARPRTHGLNEIVSVSQSANQEGNATVIRFYIRKHSIDNNSEAVGASLLLFLDRKRKIKKGGKGKKVFIEISSQSDGAWKVLAFFRARVKRRRWKSISLPLNIAQRLLEPSINHVDLKVKCFGCGKLVDLVLDKTRDRRRKVKHGRKAKVKVRRSKKRNELIQQKPKKRANPMLVISTRYKIL